MLKSKELLRAQQLAEGVHVDPRHEIVAAELVKGTSQTQACLKAGYPETPPCTNPRKS